MLSKRTEDFEHFSTIVEGHIESYTVPQYGDAPVDQIESWTPAQCMDSIKRYVNRFNTGRRGRLETLRDLIKIAHLAQICFDKMKPSNKERNSIEEGRI